MKLNTIITALLCALLLWSIHINEKAISELNHANEIIARQNKSIKEYSEMLNSLVNELENTKLAEKDKKIDLLARLINAEAGSELCCDEMKRLVGVVALNRVKSSEFPNTLEEVIYEQGQYACVDDGNIKKTPTPVCYKIARDLVINGYDDPTNIIFQGEFPQGKGVYKKIQNMYFCI